MKQKMSIAGILLLAALGMLEEIKQYIKVEEE